MKVKRLWLRMLLTSLLAVAVVMPNGRIVYGEDAGASVNNSFELTNHTNDGSPLVQSGEPRADIIIHSNASDMEQYAAKELQSTIKQISGAELPIYQRSEFESQTVSVNLGKSELELQKGGNYEFAVNFANDDTVERTVKVEAVSANPFNVAINEGFSLSPGQRGSVTASVYVPSSTLDGTYDLRLQPYVDDEALEPLALMIALKQNLLNNPGFDSSITDGWYSTTAVQDTEIKHSGEASLRLESANVRSNQSFQIKPGKPYKLKAWLKGEKAGTARMQINEIVNKPFAIQGSVGTNVKVTTEWQQFEFQYIRDPEKQFDSNWVVLSFLQSNGPGKLWIDDVTLVEEAEAAEEPSGPPAPVPVYTGRTQIVLSTMERLPEVSELRGIYGEHIKDSDGFAIHRLGNRVYILGDEPRGVLNGVYDFLEENTGVLWTRSNDTGTLYIHQENIALTKSDYWEKSPLKVRGWLTLGVSANGEIHSDYANEQMLARNKNNAKMSAHDTSKKNWGRFLATGVEPIMLGHNLNYWLPNSQYFAEHPEYYNTDKDGNYIPLSAKTQFNFYNEDLPGVFAEKAKNLIAETGTQYIGIGLNDNSNFYQKGYSDQPFTTEGGLVVQPDDPAYLSTVFFSFLNKVARIVKATHPNVKVVAYAYSITDTPPKIELDDNVVIVFAPLYEDAREPINTENTQNSNYGYNEKLKKWAEKTKNIIVYNYYGSFPSSDYERPIAEKVQADIKYYRDLGILGVLPEGTLDSGNEGWGVNALQYWLMNKLFWNPDEDIEALKTQFIQKAYGTAAEPMRRYYDLIEQGWNFDNAQQTWATNGKTLVRQYIVAAGIKEQAQTALNDAYNVADEKAMARIKPIKDAFERMVAAVGDSVSVSAEAVKTTYTKEQIMQTLDFNAAPWTNVKKPITDFKQMQSLDNPLVDTKVYLLWDDQNLYIGYENFDTDVSKIRTSPDAPNEWWRNGDDDSVETYLLDGMGGGAYYAFMSNSNALNLDYIGPEISPTWNGEWESAAAVKNDRWNIVQVIPFRTLSITSPYTGMTIMGHFFRNFHRTGSGLGLYGWDGGAVWSPADFKPINLVVSDGDPGNGEPGNGDPGNGEPGNGEPGNGNPGNGDPGNGDPGNGDQGNSLNPSTVVQTGTTTRENQLIVTENQLKLQEGKISIELDRGKNEVLLPLNTGELLKDGKMIITKDHVSLEFTAAAIGELLKAADSSNSPSFIMITLETSKTSYANMSSLLNSVNVNVKPVSDTVRLELAVIDAGGEKHVHRTFNHPVRLEIPIGDIDASLLGIYHLAPNGIPEYVDGKRSGNKLLAELSHFSEYVVLEWQQSYTDVPTDHWANEAIRMLSAKHIADGMTATEFLPSDALTRAQFAALVVRAFGIAPKDGLSTFADVQSDAWYADAVQTAAAYGIVDGVGNNSFNPEDAITREQMVVMLVRAQGAKSSDSGEGNLLTSYTDSTNVSEWAKEAMHTALENGWVQGKAANLLKPKDTATRAESAMLMYNLLGPIYR